MFNVEHLLGVWLNKLLFILVVTVCTGAGIAPALPHIEQATSDIMLIWIAKVCACNATPAEHV